MENQRLGPKHWIALKCYLTCLIILVCFTVRAASATATLQDIHDMVDICIDLHRIQKDYALIGMHVRYDNPKADLAKTVAEVDAKFSNLSKGQHLSASQQADVKEVYNEWIKVKRLSENHPTQDLLIGLHKSVEKLTDFCIKLAEVLGEDIHIDGEHYVVESGLMAMEVQRLAALYMMRSWDVAYKDYHTEVRHILDEFEKFYRDLKIADERFVSKEVKAKVTIIEKDFLVFEKMTESDSGRFVPSLAQRSSKNLLVQIGEINALIIANVEK